MSARSGKRPRPGGPLDAAYAVGRLLNQLDWHLQQAWLLPASDCKEARRHAATVGDILTQLRLTLRQAMSGTVRERVHEVILGRCDHWATHFGSVGHSDEIYAQAALLRYELTQDSEIDPDAIRAEYWADALRSVKGFAPQLFEAVENVLDETSRLALGLGRCIDRGLRPREVHRYMSRKPAECCTSPSPDVDPWCLPEEAADKVADLTCTASPFLLRAVAPGTIPPEQGWLEEVLARWAELGLAVELPGPGDAPDGKPNGSASDQDRITFVEEVDRAAREGLAGLPVTPTHLGHRKIPPAERTKPMTLQKAAKLMGFGNCKDAAERLRAAIDGDTIRCESLGRQLHVFSKSDFPKTVWDKLSPDLGRGDRNSP